MLRRRPAVVAEDPPDSLPANRTNRSLRGRTIDQLVPKALVIPRYARGSSTRPESACSPMSDSPSPSEQRACAGRPAGPPDSHASPVGPLPMPREIVSGFTSVATCVSTCRPSLCPSSARRRRSASGKRSRCPANRAFRMRFSSRRNTMMSACSRRSQPPKAAIRKWNGGAVAVYAIAPIDAWGTTARAPARGRTPRPRRRRPRSPRVGALSSKRGRCLTLAAEASEDSASRRESR